MKNISGKEHDAVATSYNNLEYVYRALGQCNKAKEYTTKRQCHLEKEFWEEHCDVAASYKNLEVFIKRLDNTIRQNNTTKRNDHCGKDFRTGA